MRHSYGTQLVAPIIHPQNKYKRYKISQACSFYFVKVETNYPNYVMICRFTKVQSNLYRFVASTTANFDCIATSYVKKQDICIDYYLFAFSLLPKTYLPK